MSNQLTLFPLSEEKIKDSKNTVVKGKPRIHTAQRNQYEMRTFVLEDIIPKDHLAREVWSYTEKLDFSIALSGIQSVAGSAGRPAIDPKILFALWMLATLKGINSSRVIAEYILEHDAFKWICGGVEVCHHTISDFRTKHFDQLNSLLTQSVAVLAVSGIICLDEISEDGMRVRASAGADSFRREGTLEFNLQLANMYLDDLNEEARLNPNNCRTRLAAGEQRAAKEKAQRIKAAIQNLHELRNDKENAAIKNRKKFDEKDAEKVRASFTDPEARVMKMACGGFRPAYNVQFASTKIGKGIVCVDVVSKGSDSGLASTLIKQFQERYEINPKIWVADTGFDLHLEAESIKEEFDCVVYSPIRYKKPEKVSKKKLQSIDYLAREKMRALMETEEAREIYSQRSETAEFVNAQTRNMGFQQFVVRGLLKVNCMALLYAIAHNMKIAINNPIVF